MCLLLRCPVVKCGEKKPTPCSTGIEGGEWSANWQITRSTRCAYLIQRLKQLGLANGDAGPQGTGPVGGALAGVEAGVEARWLVGPTLRAAPLPHGPGVRCCMLSGRSSCCN